MTTERSTRLADDLFGDRPRPLDVFFHPRNVAVVGATETAGSVGRTVLANLLGTSFGGTVFPVNPRRPSVLGVKAFPRLAEVPAAVDLAVIVTPAKTVPDIVQQCGEARVPAAIIISAGFKELGPPGLELEHRVLEQARRGGVRIIGPNCLGVMNPRRGLNATFARGIARPGNLAFISQSGALLTAILDWSLREQIGFSGFVSTGSMLDIGWGDLIDHFGSDPHTRAILVYMESIGNTRALLSAAREVTLSKPVIVIKAGRSEAAAKAAVSHTGSLTGSDEVLDAAFRRTGVLRVNTIDELFNMAEILAKQPRPAGPRLTILTNAGGPAVLATDALIAAGGELAELGSETIAALDQILPAAWSHANPIDVLGDAEPERYRKSLEIAASDPNSDGLLVVLTPQDMTEPTMTAEALRAHANTTGKPVLASWMGGPTVAAGDEILTRAGIPTFAYPDSAAKAFCYMWRYTYNLRGIYETPAVVPDGDQDPSAAARIVEEARAAGRTLLDELASKRLLEAYGLPVVETRFADSAAEAVEAARAIGYPAVVKLHSHTLTHKTDVGGVKLDLQSDQDVEQAFEAIRTSAEAAGGSAAFLGVTVQRMVKLRDAYELIIGSSIDRDFGPVLLFGAGGQLVELLKDRALTLPPLNATLARRAMEQTVIYRALRGVRGRRPVDLAALEHVFVRFGQLVIEQPWIKEIEINPLLASPDGLVALDARVVLHDPSTSPQDLPKPAIRPYPVQYVGEARLRSGTEVTFRPIRPEDEPLLVDFHRGLSERTVRQRYFQTLGLDQRTAHDRLARVCFNDYDRDLALVVEQRDGRGATHILAVGRLSRITGYDEAEFALLVADEWHRQGIGTELLRRLVDIGQREGMTAIVADIQTENLAMQRLAAKLGFQQDTVADGSVVRVRREL